MNTDMMTNEDGDYVAQISVAKSETESAEVFFRQKSTANSTKSAKYSKINKNKFNSSVSPAESVDSSDSISENEVGSSVKKHIIKSKKHSAPAGELGDPLLDNLLQLYAKELSTDLPGRTRICNYVGLQGLASSYHALPQQLRDICKLPDRLRSIEQSNALAAYGYKVLMGKV